jgi:hypothetical protein
MFNSDNLSEIDKYRVFNMYVVPAIASENLLNQITQTKCYILFTYKFADDTFVTDGIFNLKDLRDKFMKVDGLDSYDSLTTQLNVTPKNPENNIFICVFQYAPRNSFHPSMYRFDKSFKNTFKADMYNDIALKTSVYNKCFSNKFIKGLIDWNNICASKSFFDEVPANYVIVTKFDMINDTEKSFYINFDDYYMAVRQSLVPVDMRKLIKREYKKGNLYIIEVTNYLTDYFLLVHVDKSKDTYSFTFIPSPNDSSMNNIS